MEIFRDLSIYTQDIFHGWSPGYSTSSGRTGCFNGIIDFLSLSRDSALRMSETRQKVQVRYKNCFRVSQKKLRTSHNSLKSKQILTKSILVRVARIIIQNSAVNHITQTFVHIHSNLVWYANKQVHKETFFPEIKGSLQV